MRLPWLILLLIIPAFMPLLRGSSASGCSIRITSTDPSSLPTATNPMATEMNLVIKYELSTSDPSDTEVSARASGSNVYIGSPQVWADGRTITIPYKILDRPGEFASIRVNVMCSSPSGSDSDSKDLGRSYIVAIPRYSVSVEPATINKVDRIDVKVTGLDDIDDSYGTLEAKAYVNGRSYSLNHQGRGTFSREISVDFRNKAGGSKEVKVQVYKYYAGVSALDWERRYVRVLGRKPSISGEVPSTLHRGDPFTIIVSEPDGDDLSATLHAFGSDYPLASGPNEITVPRNIDSGSYTLQVDASDVDGKASKSWNVEVINAPPKVSLTLDKDHVASGDSIQATVKAWDDTPGLQLRLIVEEIGYSEPVEPNTTVSVPIPEDYHGDLTFLSKVTDRDGASASDTATSKAGFPPSVSGEIPSSLYRGDTFLITIGGDEVSGSIEAFGNSMDVNGDGDYSITVPRDIDGGSYTVSVDLSSPYGSARGSWDLRVLNREPSISITLDKDKVPAGGSVAVSIAASDDSDGLSISLEVPEISYSRNVTSSPQRVPIPSDYHGELTFIATATDRDGAAARDEDHARAGYPPGIEGDPQPSLHRGESFTLTVSGDEVSGSIEAFGGTIDVRGSGNYEVEVPTDVRAESYSVVARVSSPYGSASKRWDIKILNEKPVIEVEAPSEARVGETVTIRVSWSDDADGPEVSLTIDGEEYSVPPSGLVRYTVPEDKAGKEVSIVGRIVDIDGITATDSVTLHVPPISLGSEQGNESEPLNRSTGTSAPNGKVGNETASSSRTSSQKAERAVLNSSADRTATNASGMDERVSRGGKDEGYENGSMNVVITPGNPCEGDLVTVVARVENTSGSLWIVAPNGTTVRNSYVKESSTITLTVDEAGLWLVKWGYRSLGRTIFGQMDLHVRKRPKITTTSSKISNRSSNRSTMSMPKHRSEGLSKGSPFISPYRMTCMVVRPVRDEGNTLLPLLAMITALGFLIAWVRVR